MEDQVEYDMDEEDTAWLSMVNERLVGQGEQPVEQSSFEMVMDRLEKESYFKAAKDGTAQAECPYDDDAVCSICSSGDCENANAILFCDACNLAVHQECYGVPFIPEGQWLCRRCLHAPSKNVSCVFCPTKGGAFKQTDDGRWAHVSCTAWIPEAQFANEVFREPVTDIDKVPKNRWGLKCYLCDKKGACIQCYKANCFTAYHVSCAVNAQLFLGWHPERPRGELVKQSFCDLHTPKDCERIPLVERTTNPRRQREGKPDVITVLPGRSAQAAQAPTISIPYISVDRITKIAEKHGIDSGSGFVKLVRSYWMLKRRSRHGVPLLRRLQANHPNSSRDADRETRLKFYHLRQELEKARMLVGQTLRRERMKRELVDMRESIFLLQACPLEAILHCALDSLERRDRDGVFLEPIDLDLFPNYPKFVTDCMDFQTMRSKIEAHSYTTFSQFVEDFHLVCRNCLLFNAPDSWWYQYAGRMLDSGNSLLESLAQRVAAIGIDSNTGVLLRDASEMTTAEIGEYGLDIVYGLGPDLRQEEMDVKAKMIQARKTEHPGARSSAMQRLGHELHLARVKLKIPDIRPHLKLAKSRSSTKLDAPRRDVYRHWDLVWAKDRGWPWFPAEVVDPDAGPEDVPDAYHLASEKVLSLRPPENEANPAYLVLFFDRQRSWAWLTAQQLRLMFENERADEVKKAEPSKASMKKQVKDAYKMAAQYVKATRAFRSQKTKRR